MRKVINRKLYDTTTATQIGSYTYWKIESGEVDLKLQTLYKIADALGYSVTLEFIGKQ